MSSPEKNFFYPKIARRVGAAAHEASESRDWILRYGAGVPLALLTVAIGIVEIPARPLLSVIGTILDGATDAAAKSIRKALGSPRD